MLHHLSLHQQQATVNISKATEEDTQTVHNIISQKQITHCQQRFILPRTVAASWQFNGTQGELAKDRKAGSEHTIYSDKKTVLGKGEEATVLACIPVTTVTTVMSILSCPIPDLQCPNYQGYSARKRRVPIDHHSIKGMCNQERHPVASKLTAAQDVESGIIGYARLVRHIVKRLYY